MSVMSESSRSATMALPSPRNGLIGSSLADPRPLQRKPAPSPLQVTQIATPLTDNFRAALHASPQSLRSPTSPKAASSPSYSPRSPKYSPGFMKEPNKSPQERLNGYQVTEPSPEENDEMLQDSPTTTQSSPVTSPKEDSIRQLRNVSAPVPTMDGGSMSQASFDRRTSARPVTARREQRPVHRTVSIDSTMSSTSSLPSQSRQSSFDLVTVDHADIQQAIAMAGTPEGAIHQLLREKKHSSTQNAQLWRLVDRQRALVLGLNKDLERALAEKEKYKKRLKEHLNETPLASSATPKASSDPIRDTSVSSAPSDSQDDLPIQRHSMREVLPNNSQNLQDAVRTPMGLPSTPRPQAKVKSMQAVENNNSPFHELKFRGEVISRKIIPDDDDISPGTVEIKSFIRTTPTDRSFSDSSSLVLQEIEKTSPRGSFTARRSLTSPQKAQHSPSFDASPTNNEHRKGSFASRKPPPAPLNLRQPQEVSQGLGHHGSGEQSGSEYDDVVEVDEIPAFIRGRRKTREEDDRERAAAALREQEIRSNSKKTKRSKSALEAGSTSGLPNVPNLPRSPCIRAFSPPFPPASQGLLSPHASLAGILSQPPTSPSNSASERSMASPPLLSPGLPVSPRPSHRPVNAPQPRLPRDGADLTSPPLSPRNGSLALNLPTRVPGYPTPLPPHTPNSISFPLTLDEPPQLCKSEKSLVEIRHVEVAEPTAVAETKESPKFKSVNEPTLENFYQGLVSEAYPDLLLPPNALPSIFIMVASSRLKPSRLSTVALNGPEEEPVFTLSILSRSDRQQLWQIEKPVSSLPALDSRLKQLLPCNAKLPDRALFSGHAPAKIDARRMALEKYFEAVLDTSMDEKAALVLCRYFSTQVIESDSATTAINDIKPERGSPTSFTSIRRLTKEGYLTKRGKNFGGWKARYFVLEEPTLRYYESPGGPLLGSIKLHNAQIGRQTANHSQSPSRGAEEPDNYFRHAFLILEPKRKDSNSHLRHVLCAESDQERDEWVAALMQFVELSSIRNEKVRPSMPRTESSSSKLSLLASKRKPSRRNEAEVEEPDADVNSLQSISYETTVAAQAPLRMTPIPRDIDTPPPDNDNPSTQISKSISGPLNGNVIHNAGEWGNKAMESPKSKDKERKRSLWGFRDKHPSDSASSYSSEAVANSVRPPTDKSVFGMPLKEAIEYAPPKGTDVCLPAVVYRCLEYLQAKDAASEEGIFRLSGSNLVIKALRERFNSEGDIDFWADDQYTDIHAVASLLKQYLRELPTIILTRELHLEFLQVLGEWRKSYPND